MSKTLGAPLGGTTVSGQYGFESLASSFTTPPNFSGAGGSCFPSMVVVALGDPGTPVTCCPVAGAPASSASSPAARNAAAFVFTSNSPVSFQAQERLLGKSRLGRRHHT